MRRWIFPLLLLLAVPAVAGASDVEERNKALAKRVFEEVLAGGNWELGTQFYAPDFVHHRLNRDLSLLENNDRAKTWRQAFPDLKFTLEQVVAEGDLVSILWTAKGTHTGTVNGNPGAGKRTQIRGITLWRIADGKIREEWSAVGDYTLLEQIGLLPIPTR